MSQTRVRVAFLPNNEVIETERGENLLDIARDAGVFLSSICGGDGICGRCRVIIKKGRVESSATTLLSREEIQQGYALACQTRVIEDLEIFIPPESRAEEAQILIDQDAQRFRALYATLEEQPFFTHDPLVQRLYLEIPQPTLEDNLADQERLFREIRRQVKAPIMQMGLKVLQTLPEACREHQWKVTVSLGQRGGTTEVLQVKPGNRATQSYGVAVDVGTSTVVTHLVDLSTSRTIDAEARYNSQLPYGEEVTRRIIYAEHHGPDKLHQAITGDINNLISALISRNRIELNDIMAVFCAGNTTMLHFLLGLNPSYVRKNPYTPSATTPPPIRATEVGIKINPRGLLYTMPSIGGWVGGDITAGILSTGLWQTKQLSMLIDIGTNGEIVFGNNEWMIACSTSAGPAFEGSGIQCGMKAGRGAIERVEISPKGHIRYRTIGDGLPKGICGSGVIDAIAALFEAGYIDRSGKLIRESSPRIRSHKGQLEFVLLPAHRTEIEKDIVISQADIENLLRAKAAIYSGAKIILQSMDLSFQDIEQLLIAGGFGNYLDREKAIMLGLIPDIPLERIRFMGNTAILGAKFALLSKQAMELSYQIIKNVTYYDLIAYPNYYDEFMSAKFIPHTDLNQFPTLTEKFKEVGV